MNRLQGDYDPYAVEEPSDEEPALSRAEPAAYGGSQTRGPVGATAAGPRYSNAESEPVFERPTPQLAATPDH